MERHPGIPGLSSEIPCSPEGGVYAVALRGKGQIHDDLGEGQVSFGRSQNLVGMEGGNGFHEGEGSASPTSSTAILMRRRARYNGSSPPSTIRENQ